MGKSFVKTAKQNISLSLIVNEWVKVFFFLSFHFNTFYLKFWIFFSEEKTGGNYIPTPLINNPPPLKAAVFMRVKLLSIL